MSHRSSLCVHAAVFTRSRIRLNNAPPNPCGRFCRKVTQLGCLAQEAARPTPRKCSDLRGMLKLSFPLAVSLAFSRTHTHSSRAAIHVPDTSLSAALRCTQRPIYHEPECKVSYKGEVEPSPL